MVSYKSVYETAENLSLIKTQQSEVERIQREHQAINQSIQNMKKQILGKRKPQDSGLLSH